MDQKQREKAWDKMTVEERLLAYAKAKLADAEFRNTIHRFREEENVALFWYDAKVSYVYGGGKR